MLDTRKTTPNFRYPEKWAVLIGGGYNHRMGLYDDTIKIKRKDKATKAQSNPALLELEFGLELEEGVVYILDEIEIDTLYRVVRYSRAIMKHRGGPSTDPLTYFIASYGGDLYATFGIIDFMKSFQTPVNTLVRGTAMSAAALLTAAGTGVRQIVQILL